MRPRDVAERLWEGVSKAPGGDCWVWTGYRHVAGYGTMTVAGKPALVHRLAYELLVGPIPRGLTIDHLCRNRLCVNPLHLEPVTRGENTLRGETITAANAAKTHCDRGHAFDGPNTYVDAHGFRRCRACRREAQRRYRERQAA